MMIMMWGVRTKAQEPTPMPSYKHGLDFQGSSFYNNYRDLSLPNSTNVNNWAKIDELDEFDGQYQLYTNATVNIFTMPNCSWPKKSNNSNYISYKIENIGFPFIPNLNNNLFERKFKMPNSNTYTKSTDSKQAVWKFDGTNLDVHNYYFGNDAYDNESSCIDVFPLIVNSNQPSAATNGNNCRSNLASIVFKENYNSLNSLLFQFYYPHSILKHKYYLHDTNSYASPIIDSMIFVIDWTRNMGNIYPFFAQNHTGSVSPGNYDIKIFPAQYWSISNTNALNTLNYFPESEAPITNNTYIARPVDIPGGDLPTSNMEVGVLPNDGKPYHLHPYSLQGYTLGDVKSTSANIDPPLGYIYASTYTDRFLKKPGIPHTYTIDSPFDITQINPDEKVFYNPSVVSITSPYLVFPAGYTFKTVRGLYPTATQVYTEQAAQQANTGNTYRTSFTYDDPRHVYIPTDLAKSIYNVESGATLYIQPCVTIWDATINVKAGAKLVYDPTKTYGNYTIVNQGGTIVATTYDEEVCTECNYPNKYNYLNHNVTSDYTYTAGIHRIRDYVQVNAGATLTIPANCNLQMGPNSYIVVKPGGKLNLQGKISGRCGMQWQGIIVEGNPTQAQTYSSTTGRYTNQGYVYAYGGSIVNAETAIKAGYFNPTTLATSSTGGVVRLSNTKIRATNKGIALYDYDKSNYQSTFNGVNFNNQYPVKTVKADGTTATNYVANTTYYHIRGIKNFGVLNSNVFSNSIAEHWQTPTEYGTAVWAQNSSINVSACTFGNRVWKGLDYYSTDPLLNCSISDNVFDRCTQAVILNSGSFGKVYRNSFAVGAYGAGLLNYGHTNILVTENTFTNTANLSNNKGIIQNISGANSRIYRNTFSNIKTEAIRTENDNTGLNIDCNTYTNNVIDWNIASGTLKDQGLCGSFSVPPVANTFGTPCGPTAPSMSIIKNTTVPSFNYNSYPSKNPPTICVSTGVILNSCSGVNYNSSTDCLALPGYGAGTSAASAAARTANVNTATTNDQKTHYTNELVRLYLETGQTALAKQVLANSNSDWAKLILLKHAIANNTADVATLLNAIPNNPAISNLISDNNNTRYFKNIDAQNLNAYIPDSTDITLNKQARWSYLNNKQINRLLNDEKSFDNKIVETKFHENFNSINVLNIFPNPSTQGFNISSENSGDITVYDYTGKIVEQKLISNDPIQIGENYSKGVYVIVFKTSGAETAHYKIIKQ